MQRAWPSFQKSRILTRFLAIDNVALIGKWHGFWPLSGTYDESAAGGFDDLVGDDGQFVDLHDPFHLREKSVQEAKIAPGDACD